MAPDQRKRGYREITCKSALNRVRGMPFAWSLNPYRGCSHSCHYCFARSTHRYLDLGAGEDFSNILFIKTNLPEVLAAELGRRSWGDASRSPSAPPPTSTSPSRAATASPAAP